MLFVFTETYSLDVRRHTHTPHLKSHQTSEAFHSKNQDLWIPWQCCWKSQAFVMISSGFLCWRITERNVTTISPSAVIWMSAWNWMVMTLQLLIHLGLRPWGRLHCPSCGSIFKSSYLVDQNESESGDRVIFLPGIRNDCLRPYAKDALLHVHKSFLTSSHSVDMIFSV